MLRERLAGRVRDEAHAGRQDRAPGGRLRAAAPGAAPTAPFRLLTAAEARPLELGSVSITSVDRLLTNGATLVGRAVPLPIDPTSVRDLLLGQAGLPPEVSANLDLGAPSGAAVVSTGPAGGTGAVMAVAARGPAEAARAVAALGKQIGKRGDVVLVDNGSGGRGWIWRDGSVIVFSDDAGALARGARLAEEARHAVAEDVTAVIFPDAIARANGTDVKTALAALAAAAEAAQPAQNGKGGVSPQWMETATEYLQIVGDAEAIELGLSVDSGKGLTLRARLRARPGSRLEAIARDVRPFALDRAVLASQPPAPAAIVGATSIGSFMRELMARQRERVAAAKVKSALDYYDAYLAGIADQTSVALWFTGEAPLFSMQVAYPMKDAAAATRMQDAIAHLDKAAFAAIVGAQMGWSVPPLDISIKKESAGKLKAVHIAFSLRKLMASAPEPFRALLGGALDAYVASSGARLLGALGRGAKGNLGRLATAAPVTPTGPLADALAASHDRDSFYYFDVASILPVLAKVGRGQHPGEAQARRLAALAHVGNAPVPLYGTAGGDGAGKAWSADLTIPLAAFVNGGEIVKGVMAAGLGGGAAAPADAPARSKKRGRAHEE